MHPNRLVYPKKIVARVFIWPSLSLSSSAFLEGCELTGENLRTVLLLPDCYHGDIYMAFPGFLLHPHPQYPKDFPRWAWTYFGSLKRFRSLGGDLERRWLIYFASVLFFTWTCSCSPFSLVSMSCHIRAGWTLEIRERADGSKSFSLPVVVLSGRGECTGQEAVNW